MASNEISSVNVAANLQASGFYSTIKGTTLEDKKTVYQAVNGSDSVADLVGSVVGLKHIIVQEVEITSEDGEVVTVPRTTLVLDDGKVYSATSKGLLNSVRNIISIFGDPNEWDQPLTVKVVEKGTKMRRFYSLEVA